ncbi:MAG: hypothetical protein ACM3JK_07505 [Betaproteobacteria bacterium]
MAALVASAILLAATPAATPVHVTVNDLVGMWVTVLGDCREGQHLLSADGKCRVWCFDSISDGKWSLRGGNEILVKLDPKTSSGEIITVTRFERSVDHTILEVRYQDGRLEKWMK